jgi:hypothetical protein
MSAAECLLRLYALITRRWTDCLQPTFETSLQCWDSVANDSYQLQDDSYQLQDDSYQLQDDSYQLQDDSCQLQDDSCQLQDDSDPQL